MTLCWCSNVPDWIYTPHLRRNSCHNPPDNCHPDYHALGVHCEIADRRDPRGTRRSPRNMARLLPHRPRGGGCTGEVACRHGHHLNADGPPGATGGPETQSKQRNYQKGTT